MTPSEEQAYEQGRAAVWREMLSDALRNLGTERPDFAGLALERAEAIATLRSVCALYGDSNWTDDLHLSDIIEKHLWRHLSQRD